MDRNIINLYLTEVGRKALKCDVKVISTDKAKKDITKDYIEEIFPLALVERYEIVESFLDLENGEYVIIVTPEGERLLGTCNGHYGKQIYVSIYGGGIGSWNYFNPNGVEATHSKSKAHLERATEEEVEKIRRVIENQPFIELLEMFNEEHENVKFNAEEIKLPEWLTIDVIRGIKHDLDNAKDDFDDLDDNC